LKGTPEDLDGFYAAMKERGADVVKIAVTPRSIRDVGRLLDFAARAAAGSGPPLVPLALGPLGILTRIAAGRWGAPFTFASAGRGVEAAPGQIPAAEMADLYRARDINPLTKLYGVLGTDVVWSLSPVLHNRAFEARGLDAVYVPLQAESLDGFLAAMPALALSGFSVTRPFKVDIVPHLQEVEEQAATPVGSVALPDQSPLPAKLHRPNTVVLDMVYEPLDTRLLRDAQQAGCTIVDGLEMLLAQAVAQFETWTGLEAPVDVMKSAALF